VPYDAYGILIQYISYIEKSAETRAGVVHNILDFYYACHNIEEMHSRDTTVLIDLL